MASLSQLLLTFLLNACWQLALVAIVTLFCARLLRGTAARYTHALWVAALLLSGALPILSTHVFVNPLADDAPPLNVTQHVGAPALALPLQPTNSSPLPA